MITITEKNKSYIWLIALISIFHSCTKTEYLDYEERALNKILSFKVTNSEQELSGAINEENGTITVYIPYYLAINFLNVEITLEEGATIHDEEGNEINLDGGLDPIPVGADSIKYTVKSANGIPRDYTFIQKILPHAEPLEVSISGVDETVTLLEKPVSVRLTLLGNFESTSLNAKFTFTNRATGEVHEDFVSALSVEPGEQYTMEVEISPDAIAGEYEVRMEHQGRTIDLVPMKLYYRRPYLSAMLSSQQYAPGDTIEFNVNRLLPYNDSFATVFIGLEKLYARVSGTDLTYTPADFPVELLNKDIEMEIISATRTQVKAIFPELPAGVYANDRLVTDTYPYAAKPTYGLAFYGNFDGQTDWGNDVLIQRGGTTGITVLSPREN